MEKINQKT
jgi:hypothetical protein